MLLFNYYPYVCIVFKTFFLSIRISRASLFMPILMLRFVDLHLPIQMLPIVNLRQQTCFHSFFHTDAGQVFRKDILPRESDKIDSAVLLCQIAHHFKVKIHPGADVSAFILLQSAVSGPQDRS